MSQRRHYIPTLDGWRALSVAAVVFYHGRYAFFAGHHFALSIASRGDLGVDAFFAISGFLICSLLLQELVLTGDIELQRFYARRFFRIVPPYYVAIAAICALGGLGVVHPNFIYVPSCLLFYRNFMPLGLDWRGGYYTAHFWSLAVEEQFYLIWPVLLLALKPKQAGKVALLLAMCAYSWKVGLGHFPSLAGIMPPFMTKLAHTDGLLWGCLAALYLPEIRSFVTRMRFPQLWLPLLLILLVGQASKVPELVSLSSVVLPALVLSTVLQPRSLLSKLLEWWPLRWVGTLSYSIYIWQMIFLPEIASEHALGPFRYLQQSPWNLCGIMMCAFVSRYLIEIPMTRLGHRMASSRVPMIGPIRPAGALQ